MQYLDDAEYMYEKYRLKERPNEFYFNKKVAGVQVSRTFYSYRFRIERYDDSNSCYGLVVGCETWEIVNIRTLRCYGTYFISGAFGRTH